MIVYDVVAAAVFVTDASRRDFAREKVMHMSTNAHIYVSTGTTGGATAALVCVLHFTGKNLYGIS